jgi:hypothetical protein
VEAALLLPVLLATCAFLMQPAFLLYTRTVMQSAAAEATRVLATATGDAVTEDAVRAFVLRRLRAVPDLEIFHEGGAQGWEVELEGGEGQADASVRVTGRVRPLPLLGGITRVLAPAEGGSLRLEVHVEAHVRPDWLEGSYDDWVKMWD